MVVYADLVKLVDELAQRDDAEAKRELETVSILLNELNEFYYQSALAGTRSFMAKFYEELGEPVPENDAARKAAEGLIRLKDLFEEVNVLFEKNGFSCRFDLGKEAENEKEALANQVKIIVTDMIKNGMENYRKGKI